MKIFEILTPHERRQTWGIMALAIVAAFMETVGVASVLPFLAVLGDQGMVHNNETLHRIYQTFRYTSEYSFVFSLGVLSLSLVLISSVFRIFANYIMNRFVEMRRHSIGARLLDVYLHQPYEFFIHSNSADLSKNILSEVDQIIANGFRPFIQLVAYGFMLIAMVALLVIVDWVIAFTVVGVIGGAYFLIFMVVRGLLSRTGKARFEANQKRFQAAAEAFGAIKDIKILGSEQSYTSRFRGPSVRNASYQALNTTLAQLPKFFIEAVGFGGVVILALFMLSQEPQSGGNAFGRVLPILGIYAFAGLKLLPAAQNIYISIANMRFSESSIDAAISDLRRPTEPRVERVAETERLPLAREIRFESVNYTYPGASTPAIVDLSVVIPAGAKVGLVGSTGSGKTTLVDLLLGLLKPSAGLISIDGVALGADNMPAWQAGIGYVRQDIFLSDSTIASNIALGVPAADIDQAQVERCARIANIHELIAERLPQGYDTVVGERGIRLSGGQRQRLGIARAMYHNPQVVILDEATSALDGETELEVMKAVYGLGDQITVIMIAHRLSTVRDCDAIIVLHNGKIVAQGPHDELLRSSEKFRQLARLSEAG